MYSLTKHGVSASTIAAITRRALDMEPLKIKEMQGGFFNAVYRIRLSFGEVVLKIAPDDDIKVMRYEKNLMAAEADALNKIAEFKFMPVPHVIFYDRNRDIVNSEYLLMELMPGVPFSNVCENLTIEKKSDIFTQAGIYARKINSITSDYFGSLSVPEKRFDSWSKAFCSMIDDLLCDAADMSLNLPVDPDHLSRRIKSESKLLDIVKRPSLVHKDLWIGNILVDPDNSEITGIIDCERAIFGDALMEPSCGMLDDDKNFVCSYMCGLQFDRKQRLRMALYRIYLGLTSLIECAFRHYEDNGVEEFAKAYLQRGLREYEKYKGERF